MQHYYITQDHTMDPIERRPAFYTAPQIRAWHFREKQAWLQSINKRKKH